MLEFPHNLFENIRMKALASIMGVPNDVRFSTYTLVHSMVKVPTSSIMGNATHYIEYEIEDIVDEFRR